MKILVPLLAILLGAVFVWAILGRDAPGPQALSPDPQTLSPDRQPPDPDPKDIREATPEDVAEGSPTPAEAGEGVGVEPEAAPASLGALRVRAAEVAESSTLGSLDEDSDYQMQVRIAAWGAGVQAIHLADYTQTAWPTTHPVFPGSPPKAEDARRAGAPGTRGPPAAPGAAGAAAPVKQRYHYTVQRSVPIEVGPDRAAYLYPFAARAIRVNGQLLELQSQRWEKVAEGQYQIELVNEQDEPAVRITRTYRLQAGETSYDLHCDQRIENLTAQTLTVTWEQNAQADLPARPSTQFEERTLFAAYFNLSRDPFRRFIYTDETRLGHGTVLQAIQERDAFLDPPSVLAPGTIHPLTPLWPSEELSDVETALAWLANANRFFAAVVYRPLGEEVAPAAPGQPASSRVQPLDERFPVPGAQIVEWYDPRPEYQRDPRAGFDAMVFTLTSVPLTIEAGGHADLDLALYAGPRERSIFYAKPHATLEFYELLVYELGCTFCTFQWLARLLLWFLSFVHGITLDWSIALIILVLVVRLLLHPITKKAQTNMMVFQKQIAGLQPEMEKIRKKYGDDPQRIQQEQIRLWREHGINPLRMLGCLPMFLQMPIWVALYAMLYYAIELYNQPAFYGLFQKISGGSWTFLADLSSPDSFIRFFEEARTFNLLFIPFDYSSFNVLPLLWAVALFVQQKLMTPPAQNEQQATQQRMMRWMMLVMPLFLYSAPSALTLYFLASTGAGALDSWLVRRHIAKQEAEGKLLTGPRKKDEDEGDRKPGFLERMMAAAEQTRKDMEARQAQQGGKPGDKPRGRDRGPRKKR